MYLPDVFCAIVRLSGVGAVVGFPVSLFGCCIRGWYGVAPVSTLMPFRDQTFGAAG